MPIQAPQWTDFLSCPVCCNEFNGELRTPISLGCGHTICRTCLSNLHRKQCPFDQTTISIDIDDLPINTPLLQLIDSPTSQLITAEPSPPHIIPVQHIPQYIKSIKCIQELALYLKPGPGIALSRPMQRKLVTLLNCQLVEVEGRLRVMRAARSLGERTVTELILQHQNPQQLSANLWAAVRARGCQFLGPAMQEEVLKLVLLALEDGSALSRKVLVMFVVQRLESQYPQASKTSIGHVVQLLYRASCFNVSKRECDSSLMQLKEEFRTYEALRREHDAQIVQIATEAGLRIAPDQWSSLLYGDTAHKSHMQSIYDKLQTPQSFAQSVQELVIALQRTGDPAELSILRPFLELLAGIDPTSDSTAPTWDDCSNALEAVKVVVAGLVDFIQHHGSRKTGPDSSVHALNTKYKISMCRDLTLCGHCPHGQNCTFAHSKEELEKYRAKNRNIRHTTPIVSPIIPPVIDPYAPRVYEYPLQVPPPPPPVPYQPPGIPPYYSKSFILEQRKQEIITELERVMMRPTFDRSDSILKDVSVPFETNVCPISNFGPISRMATQFEPLPLGTATPNYDDFMGGVKQQIQSLERKITTLKLAARQNDFVMTEQREILAQELHLIEQEIISEKEQERRMCQFGSGSTDILLESTKEEDPYEVGIAHDLRDLEQRLKTDLEEQEKRWSSEEETK